MRNLQVFGQSFFDGFTFGGLFNTSRLPDEPNTLFDAEGSRVRLNELMPGLSAEPYSIEDKEYAQAVAKASAAYREALEAANRQRHTTRTPTTHGGS